MFGSIMEFASVKDRGLRVRMAPIASIDVPAFVADGAFQSLEVTRYTGTQMAPVLETEQEWHEKARTNPDLCIWGIYSLEDSAWKPIGISGIDKVDGGLYLTGSTGIIIFRREYWNRGVASSCHRARTWFALEQVGYVCLRSGVFQPNQGSSAAIQAVGYVPVGLERNIRLFMGKPLHKVNYELVNPAQHLWNLWWGDDEVPGQFKDARQRTLQALDWAHSNISFG